MKIALISGSKIPSRTANSIQTMKMAQALVEVGHKVRVIVPGESPPDSWEELASHYGLKTKINIQWIIVNSLLRSYDFGLNSVLATKRWGAELIYTRLPQSAAFASLRGFSTMLEVHDMPGGRLGPRLMRMFATGKGAKRIVSITKALRDALYDQYSYPDTAGFSVVAPDGVDLERYEGMLSPRKSRELLGLPEGFSAGYTGHLYAGRGIDLILNLATKNSDINFLIVGGESVDVSNLEKRILKLGLENVNVIGFMSNEELPRYQAACDVLLMPYQHEVAASSGGDISRYLSPMKMFEYLASERAIIASDLSVLQEILVDGENAIIVPANDEKAWLNVLKKLRADPDHKARLGVNAKDTARKYTWKKRVELILDGLEA